MKYSSGFRSRYQRRLSRVAVIPEDVSRVTSCPKCGGGRSLRIGEGNWLSDALWCVYCGWRPGAKLAKDP